MNEIMNNFIQDKQINSFQKLVVLLFLQQHPDFAGTSQEFAHKLHFSDVTLEKILVDLKMVDILVEAAHCWKLSDEPQVIVALELIVRAFEDPLARQQLFAYVGV